MNVYYKVKKPAKVVEKLEIIDKLCGECGVVFDNFIPNHYKIIVGNVVDGDSVFVFYTYDDVINALKMVMKIGGRK